MHGDFWDHIENPFSFKQRGKLTVEETKAFSEFTDKIREDILSYGRGR